MAQRQGKDHSLSSDSFGRVIIIEPVADARPVEKFFSNDLALSKALAESLFGRAGIAKFSKNLGRKILVITLEDKPGVEMSALLSTTTTWFLDYKVSCACQPLQVCWSHWAHGGGYLK